MILHVTSGPQHFNPILNSDRHTFVLDRAKTLDEAFERLAPETPILLVDAGVDLRRLPDLKTQWQHAHRELMCIMLSQAPPYGPLPPGIDRAIGKPHRWRDLALPLEAWLESHTASARCEQLEAQLRALDPVSKKLRAQQALLHDLGNISGALTLNCQLIRMAATQLGDQSTSLLKEVEVLEQGLSLMRQLHERARHSEESEATSTTLPKMLAASASLLEGAGLNILCDALPDVPLAIDPLTGTRVLFNLLHNAHQAMVEAPMPPTVPTVKVRMAVEGGCALIQITDNGPGVPTHLHNIIFERGVTTRRAVGGSGAGLYECRQALEAVGGRLTLCPEGPGATFNLAIPIKLG
ncbi:MAG: ATP-binding protein [Bradymonadia bacterium]